MSDERLDELEHRNELATNWEGQVSVEDTQALIEQIRADRKAFRAICSGINGFSYQTITDILIDARVGLTGRPREEIEAEHTIVLDAKASEKFMEIMNRPVGDYAGRMRRKAESQYDRDVRKGRREP